MTNGRNILVALLVLASFAIGVFYTKVQTLEKQARVAGQQAVAVGGNQPAVAGNDTVQPPAAQPAAKKPEIAPDDRIRGNKDAKLALIE